MKAISFGTIEMPTFKKGTIVFTVEKQRGQLIPTGSWTIHIDDLNKVLCEMFGNKFSRDVIWKVVKLKANQNRGTQHRVRKKLPSHMGMPKTRKEQKAAALFIMNVATKHLNGFDRHIEKFLAAEVEKKQTLESPTFQDFWLEHGKRNKGRKESKFHRWILPVLGNLRLDEIRPHHIDATVQRMFDGAEMLNRRMGKVVKAKGLSMNTVHRNWKEIATVFNIARSMDLDLIEQGKEPIHLRGRFPFDVRRLRVKPRRITHNQVPPPAEDFITLMQWIKENDPSMLHLTCLDVLSGVRISELVALTWGDVRWETGRVEITKAWCTKTKKLQATKTGAKTSRPMIPVMTKLLLDWKASARNKDELIKECSMSANGRLRWRKISGGRLPVCTGTKLEDYIFSHPTGRPFSIDTATGRLNKALVGCGIKRHGQAWHAFRRSWVSELAANLNAKGIDPIALIQQLGGWKSKEVVRQYLYDPYRHSHKEQLEAAFDEIYGDKILDLFKTKEDDPEEPENE